MACVALGDIYRHFAWQAWHLRHWAGSRGALGSGGRRGGLRGISAALGDIDLHFAWQAWHLAPWTVTLRGKHGTYGTGLALVARLDLAGAAAVCVAGVALGDIDRHFAWQAWHLRRWAGSGGALGSGGRRGGLRGMRGAW